MTNEEMKEALARQGYTVVSQEELERLQETAARYRGLFPNGEVIKPDASEDFYVCWSHVADGPAWCGTREEALAEDCPESRLKRADATGSSMHSEDPEGFPLPAFRYQDTHLVAGQHGLLHRSNLAAYARRRLADWNDEALDLLEPFEAD